MDNRTVYIYDIIKEFGASGLGKLIKYFYEERDDIGDILDVELCLEDIFNWTELIYSKDVDKNNRNIAEIITNGHMSIIEHFQ